MQQEDGLLGLIVWLEPNFVPKLLAATAGPVQKQLITPHA
jgi:hypothetical protein